jgi:predicted transcriptional regulator
MKTNRKRSDTKPHPGSGAKYVVVTYLDEDQRNALDRLAFDLRESRAEALRFAIVFTCKRRKWKVGT